MDLDVTEKIIETAEEIQKRFPVEMEATGCEKNHFHLLSSSPDGFYRPANCTRRFFRRNTPSPVARVQARFRATMKHRSQARCTRSAGGDRSDGGQV